MDIDPILEEVLEALWRKEVEGGGPGEMAAGRAGQVEKELLERGLVDADLQLTEAGRGEARMVVRRHRLAERLLADVLDVHGPGAEQTACQFEHLLHRGLEEKVCTLLGHPSHCPHGRAIPPGECCSASRGGELRLVSAMAELAPGEGGSVAYLHGEEPEKMQKLLAMGVLPGTSIRLLRRSPSFIFESGYSQFAVDEEMARGIYVRLEEAGQAAWPAARRRRRP